MKDLKEFEVSQSLREEVIEMKKGAQEYPFTIAEYEQLSDDGQWNGGYVKELGLMESETDESNQNSLYGYDSWDFEWDDYGNTHTSASEKAEKNKKDCLYRCIANVLGVEDSRTISDIYQSWLINQLGMTSNQADETVGNGMKLTHMLQFSTFLASKKNQTAQQVSNTGIRSVFKQPSSSDRQIIGVFKTNILDSNDAEYHAVIANSLGDDGYVRQYDPQNPDNEETYALGMFLIFYVFEKNN